MKTVEANEGDDILAIAHEYDIDLEGTSSTNVSSGLSNINPIPPFFLGH